MGIKIGDIDASYFKVGSSDCKIYLGDTLLYPQASHDYSLDYFTLKSKQNHNATVLQNTAGPSVTISYSTDNGSTWVTAASSSNTSVTLATLNEGDTILVKGENVRYAGAWNRYNQIKCTSSFEAQGNIMSLFYGDNFVGQTTFSQTLSLAGFFSGSSITSAENLIMPVTSLQEGSYNSMFAFCTSLTTAPELFATTLGKECYSSMFEGCTALANIPIIHAENIGNKSMNRMFCMGYNSATTAAMTAITNTLSATSITGNDGCIDMFRGNASLVYVPSNLLPTLQLYTGCYRNMFQGCTSLTVAPQLPATSLANGCYQSMFKGCTSLTVAPSLQAETLASSCYNSMFNGCSSLTTAPSLPAETLASSCYNSMFNGCTSLATAPSLPATTLTGSCYSSMFQGCSSLNRIECNADTYYSSATAATYNWVSGVAASGKFIKNSSNTWWTTGNSGIPTNWTVVNDDTTYITYD